MIDVKEIEFEIDEVEEEIEFELDEFVQIQPDTYPGPYDVIPKVDPQQLLTANKFMKNNVTVWGIPYEEVHNEYGITVTIAE